MALVTRRLFAGPLRLPFHLITSSLPHALPLITSRLAVTGKLPSAEASSCKKLGKGTNDAEARSSDVVNPTLAKYQLDKILSNVEIEGVY